jgi:transcriptional regulator with GAF, ATPase, and Fis domain
MPSIVKSAAKIIGRSPQLVEMLETVLQVAPTEVPVLIEGESGTGKELVARAVHLNSQRAGSPFIVVNASAIPRELLESELFGRERGAYTGALTKMVGRFEIADGSTLFLDEIGEMPRELQVKILRAIEGHPFMRVGGTEEIDVDVRLITATHRDLKAAVEAGEFREDLFYRLHVVSIKLPPLRERRGDIPLLISHFVGKHKSEVKDRPLEISEMVLQCLENYSWPGNVRELENTIEYAVAMAQQDVIPEDLILQTKEITSPGPLKPLKEARDSFEMGYLIYL